MILVTCFVLGVLLSFFVGCFFSSSFACWCMIAFHCGLLYLGFVFLGILLSFCLTYSSVVHFVLFVQLNELGFVAFFIICLFSEVLLSVCCCLVFHQEILLSINSNGLMQSYCMSSNKRHHLFLLLCFSSILCLTSLFIVLL